MDSKQDRDLRWDIIIGFGLTLIVTLGLCGVPVAIWLRGRESIPFLVVYGVVLVAAIFLMEDDNV